MPYLKIQMNQALDADKANELIKSASSLVASELGKPENYVMVAIEPPVPMVFAGSDDPAAYMELKSIGLPENQTRDLSSALCQLMEDHTQVSKDRIYIEFANAPRAMWGWNGATF